MDGSCNPYLAATVILAAGRDGIERKVDPGEPRGLDPEWSERQDAGPRAAELPRCPNVSAGAQVMRGFGGGYT